MVTEEQRQQFRLKGYDIVFERNDKVFAVNSKEIANWSVEKQKDFSKQTGLDIFFEKDRNPVFYDPRYFHKYRVQRFLCYTGNLTEGIPQPINCHSMNCMFYRYSGDTLDLSDWDVSSVRSTESMFYASNVEYLNLSGWNVKNITKMFNMFALCERLRDLDLTGWHLNSSANVINVFYKCDALIARYGLDFFALVKALDNGQWPPEEMAQQPQRITI